MGCHQAFFTHHLDDDAHHGSESLLLCGFLVAVLRCINKVLVSLQAVWKTVYLNFHSFNVLPVNVVELFKNTFVPQ